MTLAIILVLVSLIGFAIYKRDSVKASFQIFRVGFFIEAKNNDRTDKGDKIQ
jgi:hypothetical protein